MGVSEELIRDVSMWVTEIGTRAAQLPTQAARSAFLAEKYRELMLETRRLGMDEHDAVILVQACVVGAERIMQELLARGIPSTEGRA